MLPPFTFHEWLFLALGAFCIGISKSGFSGIGLLTVVVMARLFPPRESTGVLLPLLIVGDILSVIVFHQHAQWPQIWRMLPPTIVGVLVGYVFMLLIPSGAFGPLIGWIVFLMVVLQTIRKARPDAYAGVPHTRWFAWIMGTWSGITTMLANAAGPVMTLYFLAIKLPKYAFVGTSAWFFLIVNLFKVPLSAHLGLITASSLSLNVVLIPIVAVGIFTGKSLIKIVPQSLFEWILLIFAAAAALRLIGLF